MEVDKDLPFETLLKLENQLGSKTFHEAHMKKSEKSLLPKRKQNTNREDDSDEAPEEFSSKHPPKQKFIKSFKQPKQTPAIDPRFNPRSGTFKADHFRRNFQFAFDLKDQELDTLKNSTHSMSNSEEKEKVKYLIQRRDNQKREQLKKLNKPKPIINKDGYKYYPSKKEIVAQELVTKYDELKGSGKLQSYLEKRRKKQAGKERKKMGIEK
ncbi:CLUMA_CG008233, isoform A [Clunio marinus]|uniref:rRNA biogenesis protein RRP36 n=1 Tax=Clunio marinus TaxID=568069 RepID=A0A1J1I360_9DIPT|nr:CLUMA_CG008233, isoform A [Clunio marinus]